MDNIVNFTINLNGTAYTDVAQLDEMLGNVLVDVLSPVIFRYVKTQPS